MGVVGTAIGLVYPVTTVSIQNAVPHYQVGIAMGALNFFRALASAFAVAVMGAILLAGLGVTPRRGRVGGDVDDERERRRRRACVPLGVCVGVDIPCDRAGRAAADGGTPAALDASGQRAARPGAGGVGERTGDSAGWREPALGLDGRSPAASEDGRIRASSHRAF